MKAWSKLLNGIRAIFRSPRKGKVYAITRGDYLGEFFVYMEETDAVYCFLSLPDLHIRTVSRHEFNTGIDNTILDPIGVLPRSVRTVCDDQYRKIKSGN